MRYAFRTGAKECREIILPCTKIVLAIVTGCGRIATVLSGEATDFFALDDSVTVVVKTPSVLGDKYQSLKA